MLIKELRSKKKGLYKNVHRRWPARRAHCRATTEQNALSHAKEQTLTHTCWVSLINLVLREASWTENKTLGMISAKMNLWWKTRAVVASGERKNCLGRNRKEFSEGDGNILFLKGWKLYGHVYLPKLYDWDFSLSVCVHLTSPHTQKGLKE